MSKLNKIIDEDSCIERIVIIDHEDHVLYIEDVPVDQLEKYYHGEEEDYIKDNYPDLQDKFFTWDYIQNATYIPYDYDPIEINFSEL